MNEWLFGPFEKALELANKGGALSASALLFLWAAIVSFILYKRLKWESEEQLKRLEAWLATSKGEERQTSAIVKVGEGLTLVAEAQKATATQVAIIVALIKDRRGIE